MIRKTTMMLAAAGSAAILAGSIALAGSASAASLPSCATGYRCTTNSGNLFTGTLSSGVAGYYGADDNHTHYRYVQTVVTATTSLANLNGTGGGAFGGGVGTELCDPNNGRAAQISLSYNGPVLGYQLIWSVGNFGTSGSVADPCVQTGFAFPNSFRHVGTLLSLPGISAGDQIYMGIYYNPIGNSVHFHQISFGACDITTGICRQAYSQAFRLEFWEFGIGAFSAANFVQGGAINPLGTLSHNVVTCYSCTVQTPLTSIQPVNPFGIGGLYEAQFANTSGQIQMSPLDSLTPSAFKIWSGSTGGI